jgi:Icc-related predicted phosphoesterase
VTVKIFFATDLHGSDVCFKKFCAAPAFYGADALIMGGDLTGKLLVPFRRVGSNLRYQLGGVEHELREHEFEDEARRISDMGYYPVLFDEELEHRLKSADAHDGLLTAEAVARAHRWARYAEEKLGQSGTPILFAPGNDDENAIDEVFARSPAFIHGEGRAVDLLGIEVLSTGWANPTPWHTPRECAEEELAAKIHAMAADLHEPEHAVFNFHVPPYDTTLDICPLLDGDLRVVKSLGAPLMTHAGSSAVRAAIEELQPLVSLHGHIHESRSVARLGRTVAINPGSEYSEGVLLGSVLTIDRGNLAYTLTAG